MVNIPSSHPKSGNSTQKQITNAQTRITAAGGDASGDSRNWFEKLTNLPQNQNAFLDALDLLQRPQQSINGFLDAAIHGTSVPAAFGVAADGFAGRSHVSGSDLIGDFGVQNPAIKAIGGLGWDLLADPLNLAGGAIAKGVGVVGKGIGAGFKAAEKAVPALGDLRNSVGKMVNKDYGASADQIARNQDFLNTSRYFTDKFGDKVTEIAQKHGPDIAQEVSRLLENDLKWTEDPNDLISQILKGDHSVNVYDGAHQQFIDNLNSHIKSQPEYSAYTSKLDQKITNAQADIQKRMDAGKDPQYVQKVLDDLLQKQKSVNDLIQYTPLTNGGKGFEAAVGNPRIVSKLLGNKDEAINAVSPKGHIDQFIGANQQTSHQPLTPNWKYGGADKEDYAAKHVSIGNTRHVIDSALSPPNIIAQDFAGNGLHLSLGGDGRSLQIIKDAGNGKYDILGVAKWGFGKNPDVNHFVLAPALRSQGIGQKLLQAMETHGVDIRNAKLRSDDYVRAVNKYTQTKNAPSVSAMAMQSAIQDMLRTGTGQIATAHGGSDAARRIQELLGKDVVVKGNKKGASISLKQGSALHGEDYANLNVTDRIKQIEINRPQRQISTDPRVHAAAQDIRDLYTELNTQAAKRGQPQMNVSDWLHHTLSRDQLDKRVQVSGSGVGHYGGNDAVNSGRRYKGSIEDVNERVGPPESPLFNDNAYVAAGIGLKKNVERIEAESHFQDLMKPYSGNVYHAGTTQVPKGYTVIQPEQYRFFPVENGVGIKAGTKYFIPEHVKRYFDYAQSKFTDSSISDFMKGYDKIMSLWKASQFFSPSFHVRNALGSSFNMWIGTPETGGMNPAELVKYTTRAMKEFQSKSGLWDEFSRQGLRGSTFAQNDIRYAGKNTDEAFVKRIENAGKMDKNPFNVSTAVGNGVDTINRYAFYTWLRDAKGLGKEEAAAKVREVLFDYEDLTPLERNARRVIPFYTWMKKNAAFQLKNFLMQPQKYTAVDKANQNIADATGVDESLLPDWLQEAMGTPFGTGDGNAKVLNVGLPSADLAKWAHPIDNILGSLTPAVSVPLQMQQNHNFLTHQPIEKFQGQTAPAFGTEMDRSTKFGLDQIGLLRNLDNMLSKPGSDSYSFGLLRDHNAQQAQQFHELDLLSSLNDEIARLKQNGTTVPTIRQLGRGK